MGWAGMGPELSWMKNGLDECLCHVFITCRLPGVLEQAEACQVPGGVRHCAGGRGQGGGYTCMLTGLNAASKARFAVSTLGLCVLYTVELS